jgi:O-antigen/teichoic acid export membrane protein
MKSVTRRFAGPAWQSLLLAAVRIVSILAALGTTVILARGLSLEVYGTYAQLNLIVVLATAISALGLPDAANYFFNRSRSRSEAAGEASSVLMLQIVFGLVTAAILAACSAKFVGFANNPLLGSFVPYICMRPMLQNVSLTLQVLAISNGRASTVAIRNLVFSLCKVSVVLVVLVADGGLGHILGVLLFLDLASAAWFWWTVSRAGVRLKFVRPNRARIGALLLFSLPMAVYVGLSAVSREVDKLIITAHFNVSEYAVYANASIILPLDVVSSAFLVILIPVLTRLISTDRLTDSRLLFREYIAVGYLTTVSLTLAALLVAPDLISILFGERYLAGVWVFRLYLVATAFKFAAVSLVLSASGRTRALMVVSVLSLVGGTGMSYIGYEILGFEGPAAASVLTAFATTTCLLILSQRTLGGSLNDVFATASAMRFVIVAAVAFGAFWSFLSVAGSLVPSAWIRILFIAPLFVCVVLGLNWRQMKSSMSAINAFR